VALPVLDLEEARVAPVVVDLDLEDQRQRREVGRGPKTLSSWREIVTIEIPIVTISPQEPNESDGLRGLE
jgi:hypothetical protein